MGEIVLEPWVTGWSPLYLQAALHATLNSLSLASVHCQSSVTLNFKETRNSHFSGGNMFNKLNF